MRGQIDTLPWEMHDKTNHLYLFCIVGSRDELDALMLRQYGHDGSRMVSRFQRSRYPQTDGSDQEDIAVVLQVHACSYMA